MKPSSNTNRSMSNTPNKYKIPNRVESYFSRYKELIITTIICLFLTGIYDSINTQTAEIKKWYQLMVNLQAEQRIQTVDLEALKESLDQHLNSSILRFNQQESRIRTLEYEIIPYKQRTEPLHD